MRSASIRWEPINSIKTRISLLAYASATWFHMSPSMRAASTSAKNSLTEAERADERRSISQRKRKLIERVFGWAKLDRPLRQVKLRGLKRVDWFYRLTITAYNLVRMRRLMPVAA